MKLLVLIATLLFTWPAQQAAAQHLPLTPQATAERPVPAPVDSAALLHQLFKHGRFIVLFGGVAALGISNGIHALDDPSKARQIIGGVAVGANTGLLVMMVINRIKFSRRREREAIDQLQRHQLLRPYVQRSYTMALVKASIPRR